MQFHEKNFFLIYLISRVILLGLFQIFWPAVYFRALCIITYRYESGTGNAEAVKELGNFITDHFIPSLKVISVHGGCCVTAKVKQKKINTKFT